VNEKSVAKLGSVSLMSSPAISITTGLRTRNASRAGQAIASQETVSIDDMTRKLSGIADSAEGLITQVQGELKGISGQAQTLLANLERRATGPANRKQIAEILRQVNSLVATQSPKIDRITDQVLLVSRDADSAIEQDRSAGGSHGRDSCQREFNDRSVARPHPARPCTITIHDGAGEELDRQPADVVRSNDDNIHETIENIRVATENLGSIDRPG
jgi:hypothetical protein